MTDQTTEVRTRPLLEVSGLSVAYGGVRAVDGVSFSLAGAVIHGIIGPNGSGKTSLLNALSGFVPTTAGRTHLSGLEYTGAKPEEIGRLGIARTFQSIRLVRGMSVLENVMLGADSVAGRRLGLDWWFGRRRARLAEVESLEVARAAIDRVGLTARMHHEAITLPYGLQRKVEMARALALAPKLLLLDEPTAGMREDERADISELILSIRDTGTAVIVIEHNLRMMRKVSDRLMVLANGRLIAEGEPALVLADHEVQTAYLGRVES